FVADPTPEHFSTGPPGAEEVVRRDGIRAAPIGMVGRERRADRFAVRSVELESTGQSALRGRTMPLLFSYGTLQQPAVQMSTFGRLLRGQPDEIVGFEKSLLEIDDPQFVATSGSAHHAIVQFNGRSESRVSGTVLELTDDELAKADRYEPAGYKRVHAMLASGRTAWVYAAANETRQGEG